ncbi:BTAD domain-containing putative transcriptional regulator [Sphaerisporangium corydalis]|uniref:BTAD domain-containing putative transcriptional regulator n=1 Tax=Sphaerisporangium corydalis TaxID=1441875 RepID=A0ABV9E9Y8_9ACTN|nr:BTAD domain-containing putative transcriptional regulator [Sphaerisporangium corydalis]
MTLGEFLLAHRERAGITQRELADQAGISVRTLRDIEQGVARRLHTRSGRKLAEAVGLSAAELDMLQAAGPPPTRPTREAVLRVDLLGPLTIRAHGRDVDLKPSMQRRLLGLLALQANRVVTHAEIVDFLWAEEIPGTYLNLVHTYVSRLRRFFDGIGAGEELISRTGAGYRLTLATGQSDALTFADLVDRASAHRVAGEPEQAEDAYGTALSLWRGQALADLAPLAPHHPDVVALSQRRLTAVLEYAGLALDLGHHQAALTRLREIVHAEPLHEGLNALIVLALAGSGQRAAALRLFQDLRRRLRDDLGIEPGPELRDAYLRTLHNGAGPAAPTPAPPTHTPATPASPASGREADHVPAGLPPDIATFTGRERQIGELDAYLAAVDGHPAAAKVSVISGMAGVGKTALAVHWSHHVRHRFTDGQLFYNLHGYSDNAAKTAADALTGFLLALGVAPAAVPFDVDARVSLFRSMTANRRMLLVLDNATSPEQVRPLIPASPHSAVVVTSRNDLSGLTVYDDALIVHPDVLTDEEAVALLTKVVGARAGGTSPEMIRDLARLCAHLPLALRIAAANISRGAYGTVEDYVTALREGDRLAELAIGDTRNTAVETAFALSYAALPPRAARLFRLLGLVPGTDFTLGAAAALSGLTATQARQEVGRLAAAHLLDRYAPGRYRFHDLLRLYAAERARDEETPEDLAAAGRRLYDWYLLNVRAAVERSHPHWARLPLATTPEGVVARSEGVTAGDVPSEAVTAVAFADLASAAAWLAAEHHNLVAAVHQAARTGPRRSAWLLVDAMRSHFWASGNTSDWLSCAQTAATAAREEGDVPGMASATLALANAHVFLERDDALPLYTQALALADQGEWKEGMSSIRNNLAGHYLRAGQLDDAARSLREGIKLDEEDGRSAWLGVKHVNLAAVYAPLGLLDAAYRHLTQALELHSDPDGMIALNLGEVCHLQGRLDEALEHLTRAHARCVEAGSQAVELPCLVVLAEVHCDLGRYDAATALARQALDRGRDSDDRLAEAMAHNALGRLHERTGRHAQAVDHHRRATELAGEVHWLVRTAGLIGLANAARGLGRADAASHAEQAFRIARERSFRIMEGLARTALADIALTGGDPVEAVRQARLALDVHRRTGHRLGEARTLATLANAAPDALGYREQSARLFHEIIPG